MSTFASVEDIESKMECMEVKLEECAQRLATMESMAESTDLMKIWPADRVRSTFINYFVSKRSHTFWPSSPVVPVNDPTLLFANSGMNQFKPLFLGTCAPELDMSKLKMAVNSQKCIRAGGKHNDLEDVGKDVYHHTFFEMLGNWSFGCYFKEEAITWAWECLINEFGINPERLYATYFGGDASQGLAVDNEAREIWLRFLPTERVIPFGCKDNFWEMGPTGPCGPCTEIHYDRVGGRDAASLVNADRPDVIEIWNNVFIQFNREADASLKELPNKHVDTGMGFERLSSILQGKSSNYDTDIFMPIFAAIQQVSGCRPYQGLVGAEDVELIDMAYRVVADHIRTLTFAITDGAVPSSDGRGYVLRRILRRAVRYGQELLGAPAGFFTSLVPVVVSNFSGAFPELLIKKDFVMAVVSDEESSFHRTLDLGVKHFKKVVAGMQSQGSDVVPAKEAHFLFSSMGFPLDLTELMAAERGMSVDKAGFQDLMDQDRRISEAAEAARKGGNEKNLTMEAEQTAWLISENIAVTDCSTKYNWHHKPEARVVALFEGRGLAGTGFTGSVTVEHGQVGVLLDVSSFYYESGGQTFDCGALTGESTHFTVDNAQTYAGYVVHVGHLQHGQLTVGDTVSVCVDYERRALIAPNHTMTHVLNYALKTVLLGDRAADGQGLCDQKGSLVDAEKLRFDFSWNGALKSEELARVEEIVNQQIRDELPVHAEVVPLSAATGISGLRKVFGERYPDPVRVISVGQDISTLLADPSNLAWSGLSIEFCGGTHLSNTREAEAFALIEESGIAKGIRRITGLTRGAAHAARQAAAALHARLAVLEGITAGPELNTLTKTIKTEIDQAVVSLVDKDRLRTRAGALTDSLKVWHKATLAARIVTANAVAEATAREAHAANKAVVVVQIDFGGDAKVAKKMQEVMRAAHASGSFCLLSLDDEAERIAVFVSVSVEHQIKGVHAKEWLEAALAVLGAGKGGGKHDQANGSVPGTQAVLDTLLLALQSHSTVALL